MARINVRDKGAVAERFIAKKLEEWWNIVEPGCKFMRSPGSGGWSTPTIRSEFKAHGDIITTAHRFPFTIEVKRREQWTLKQVTNPRPSGPVWDWWIQAQKDARNANAIPIMIFRKNNELWRMFCPENIFQCCASYYAREESVLQHHHFTDFQMASIDYGAIRPVMMFFDSLMCVPPSFFASPIQANPGLVMPLMIPTIESIPFDDINPAPYNPRRIEPGLIEQVKKSIRTEGFIHPLVIQHKTYTLISGHVRHMAIKEICIEDGIKRPPLPCYVLTVDDRRAKLINIRLNKLTAKFDDKMLGSILAELDRENKLTSDEIMGIGSSDQEIMVLINKAAPKLKTTEEPTKAFGSKVTMSFSFTDVEVRDRCKRHIDARCQRENKTSGDILAEILGLTR